MAWNSIATLQLTTDWQFTDVLSTGCFFQIRHDNAPTGSLYVVAQIELISDNDNDKILIYGSQVLAVDKNCIDIVQLVKPEFFTNRRLALKRFPTPATVESELKRLLIPTVLQPVNTVRFVRENPWIVDIKVSSYTGSVSSNSSNAPSSGIPSSNTNSPSDPFFANKVLLCHFNSENNSTTFTDIKGHTITSIGNIVISTTQSKYGNSSAYFDGNSSLKIEYSKDLDFSSINSFTLEFDIYPLQLGVTRNLLIKGQSATATGLNLSSDGSLFLWADGTGKILETPPTIKANQWNNIAVVSNNNNLKIYIEGQSTETVNYNNFNFLGSDGIYIGQGNYNARYIGYLDELSLETVARYTTNFTPKTSAFLDK